MIELTVEQLSLSTADSERTYFTGEGTPDVYSALRQTSVPTGTFRVVEGRLIRIVSGIPPQLQGKLREKPR